MSADGQRRYKTSIKGESHSQRGHHALKSALFLSAFDALKDPDSRAYYDRKRAHGRRLNAALICLARRRVDVLFAMLRDGNLYRPGPAAVAARRPGAGPTMHPMAYNDANEHELLPTPSPAWPTPAPLQLSSPTSPVDPFPSANGHLNHRTRRYPLYWDARSSGGETAGRLLAQHRGTVVPAGSADELFTGLAERLEALEQMSQAPLETAMAVARLKRYLPDPVRRIDLHDLVMAAVDRTLAVTPTAKDTAPPDNQDTAGSPPRDPLGAVLEEHYSAYLHATEPLLALVTTGVFHDRERTHSDLWIAVLQRLLQGTGSSHGEIQAAERYPALLLLLRAAGIIAVDQGRDDVLLRLLTEPTGRVMDYQMERLPAHAALAEYRVFPDDAIDRLPRWKCQKWSFPSSHLLLTDLREPLRALLPDEEDYRLASYRYEYLLAVHAHSLPQPQWGGSWVQPGEFIGDRSHTVDGKSWAERDFLDRADRAGEDWAWWKIVDGHVNLRKHVNELNEVLASARQRRWR